MMSFLKENYFLKKSKFAYEAMESDIINRTIESIPKQIDQSFKIKGQRTNY